MSEIEKQHEIAEMKQEKEVEKEQELGHCPFTIDVLWKIFDWSWLNVSFTNEFFLFWSFLKLYYN